MEMRPDVLSQDERAREILPPRYADYVLEDLLAWRQEGLQTALVTLVAIDGASPRPLGSQIAVASDGRAVGAVTGGCAEQAIVLDALNAMARGSNHLELYGKGSRFKDIVLPCGSGAYMYFDLTFDDNTLSTLVTAHRHRRTSVYICEGPHGAFERRYYPQNRLVIFGRGHIVPALAQLGHLSEYETITFCPDDWTRQHCEAYGPTYPLMSSAAWDKGLIDAYTAVVSLFHDHDFEQDILSAALGSEACYIGALGSQRTHAQRLSDLERAGWSETARNRIDGPAGLDVGAKTPPDIALSIMAKLIATKRKPEVWEHGGLTVSRITHLLSDLRN
jgi:xanthine dehydrogenase accessory factor